jgi:uncharacterized protein YecE (DUF72 family)
MKGRAFIGTSGWMYDWWEGVFYPPDMKKDEWLQFYMRHFDTVEINNTFYHLPAPSAFEGWKKAAPKGFIYALKGNRFITHMKKLKDPEEPIRLFMERAEILRDSLGPILFQLPPRWRCNLQRLREFVRVLPSDRRFAFEFREPTWFNEDVYEILRERDISLCIYHMPDYLSPVEVTATFVYIRFHGTTFLYGGRYSKKDLSRWADLIGLYLKGGLDVYVYFNNDEEGYAVVNAKELREMMG